MKSYTTYRHHDPSRFSHTPSATGQLHCDDRASRMLAALAPAEKPRQLPRPVTIRRFSWESGVAARGHNAGGQRHVG